MSFKSYNITYYRYYNLIVYSSEYPFYPNNLPFYVENTKLPEKY